MDSDFKQTALQKITGLKPGQTLIEFVSWLDLACCGSADEQEAKQVFVRAVIALGYELAEREGFFNTEQPIVITMRAAENYVLNPNESNWDKFEIAATDSYPFGPGNGCFSVKVPGYTGCGAGTGCGSGVGSLVSLGLPDDTVVNSIQKELLLWLKDEDDLIITRVKRV